MNDLHAIFLSPKRKKVVDKTSFCHILKLGGIAIQQQVVKTTYKVISRKGGYHDWEEISEYVGKDPKMVREEPDEFRLTDLKIVFEDGKFFFADYGVSDKIWPQGIVKIKVMRDFSGTEILEVAPENAIEINHIEIQKQEPIKA